MEDIFNEIRLRFKSTRPDVESIVQDLFHKEGSDYEKAVCGAFSFLGLSAGVTTTTEAESDVIAEAKLAENPYYIVIECQAVAANNEVGYQKLGQIRGNASSYADSRRQQIFKNGYKLIVGKPKFSSNCRERSDPDVGLITAGNLAGLLRDHEVYRFSQSQLQSIFRIVREIEKKHILDFVSSFERRTDLYALIYISLLEDPYDEKAEKWKAWTPIERIMEGTMTYARLLGVRDVTDNELKVLIRDLDNPFFHIIELQSTNGRLCASDFESSSPFGEVLGDRISFYKGELRNARAQAESKSVWKPA